MNRIRLLPEQVANQIAAGEVVERPASVVKELVENALDAKAARITVEIQAGGRSLIRVTDDGLGMSRDDALLCLERHATSKIRNAEDLGSIATMGFRGEALPSIASVSRMTLTTREREDGAPEGAQIIIHGGKILEVKAAGSAPGTCIEVRQLFFNLPVRRKFLRSEETERSHIQHYLTLAALAYPEVAFSFLHEQRVVWQLPPSSAENQPATRLTALQERMRALPGPETRLLPVDFSASIEPPRDSEQVAEVEPGWFRIWGFIGEPGISRATREEQHLFVNRRPVENRGLNFALMEGYHTALMKGRYPVCCLFLEINPAAVDVNVHPAKKEIKFHQEQAVRRLVAQAIRETLLSFHKAPAPATAPEPSPRTVENTLEPKPVDSNLFSAKDTCHNAALILPNSTPPVPAKPIASWPAPLSSHAPFSNSQSPLPLTLERTIQLSGSSAPVSSPPPSSREPVPLLNVPLRLVGVIGKLYVVLESDRGLVLLDQHAAHERILFEQMLGRLEQGDAPSQRLLLPETVELSARDAHFLGEQLTTLARLGVGLSEFGEQTFLLDALPPFVKVSDARRFVLELVDELKAAGEGVNSWRLGEQTVAKTVCRHAVKANDPLTGPELENLVDELRHCAMPYTCPHGRPTLIEMNLRELDKKFGRTQ
ncbi:MAG: DNA mismatch repair endonuclease MutL [Pedosphaera sp.]|nr:DNA mismatch repair endonuclease MutL [Pedosphaera sp.]